MRLPTHLAEKIGLVSGAKGREWVSRFDSVLREAVEKWGLEELQPFENLSFHFVARARQGGTPVVLKLGVSERWLVRESGALTAFEGGPVPRLLGADLSLAAMLLEDVQPGIPLAEEWSEPDDETHTVILAETMVALWRDPPASHSFDTTHSLAKAFERETRFVPRDLVERAAQTWRELEATAPAPKLIHGDLHHGNVLRSEVGHKAIDPMGVVGDPGFEVYALLHNPVQATNKQTIRLIEPRLRTVSAVTGIEIGRLRAWGFCGIVLSSCWDEEDGGEPTDFELAEVLL